MRKLFCLLLCLLLALPALCAAEAEEEDLDIEEYSEDDQEHAAAQWNFPVALEDMKPEFVVLANKHYLLGKDFVCKPLVKIKKIGRAHV